MKKLKLLAAALAVLALPSAILAQGTPEQAAERYLQTLKAQDWAANSGLMDPAELDSMKAAFLDAATSDTSTAGLREIFNIGSVPELRALAPAVVYQRFAANVIGQREGMAQFLGAATFRVMGHVQEGDSAWVVYRVSGPAGGAAASQVSLMALRSVGGAWKARLSDEVRGMLTGLRQAAAQRRAANQALERLRASGQLPADPEHPSPAPRPPAAPASPPPAAPASPPARP
ncbi:MAG TPA: hypothetical protein VFJ82_22560 [Longimicrobium sp.]|nr:hypothetical protein [Longimicrobium sp.]